MDVVLDEAVVGDDVHVVVGVNLLDDEVVGVDEVDVLVDVNVLVNIRGVIDDDDVAYDLNVVVVVVDVSELLIVNDDVDDVGIDHLDDVRC